MQRARRLASIAAIAAVGILALSGCRSEPTAAVYVGDHSYSRSYVNQLVDEIKDLVPPEQLGEARRHVVRLLVLRDAAKDYVEAHHIPVPPVDRAAFAQQQGLPSDARFTELVAEVSATVGAVQRSAKSTAPTEADQREAYSHATVQGNPVRESFESVRQFFNEQQIGQSVGVRNLMNEIVAQADVSVNPVYGDLNYQVPVRVGPAESWLAVPLGKGEPTVVAPH